jgi:hypothetical protein
VSKYLVQPVARMPRTGLWSGSITLVNGDWFRNLPKRMRKDVLNVVYGDSSNNRNVVWDIRVGGQSWRRS